MSGVSHGGKGTDGRLRLAVHKFTSCDGCQLAFLNLGEALLELAGRAEIVHFAEAGPCDPEAPVDVAFVEGSISTPEELERIRRIRDHSRLLVAMGACATSGGLQALRNAADGEEWLAAIYPEPAHLRTLARSTALSGAVRVDLELWGCPVSSRQVLAVVQSLLAGVSPENQTDSVCLKCKRSGAVCVLVTGARPCLGPVTRTGCGALCPRFGRACYGCYGPTPLLNTDSLARRFAGFGLLPEAVARRFLFIHSAAPAFAEAGRRARDLPD